jgi:heptosyltransferase-3
MFDTGPGDSIDLARVRRVLVTKLRHHGDVLLSSPVFAALRRHAPHLEVDALVYADTAPLLANHPDVAALHVIDRGWRRAGPGRQLAAEWRLLRTLRARDYELVVHLTDHRRGAWLARAVGARYAVAQRRPDAGALWARAFTHLYPAPRGRPRHAVELNLDALRRIGLRLEEADKALVLVPGADAELRADELCAAHRLGRGEFLVLHPGSRWMFKALPPERMTAIAARLLDQGWCIALTGAPDARERAYVDAVIAPVRAAVVDLSGQLGLLDLAALVGRARAFVGVDSAPMHIAAAMRVPVVAFFGPSGEREWGPWRVASRVVASRVHPCRPCGNDGCGGGKRSECLAAIEPADVVAALDEVLAGAPPARRA